MTSVQFTPIGKRNRGKFQVLHSYSAAHLPELNTQRSLFHALKDKHLDPVEMSTFDETEHSIREDALPIAFAREIHKERNTDFENTGLGVKELESIIKSLRADNLNLRLKYKELLNSIQLDDRDIYAENLELKLRLKMMENDMRSNNGNVNTEKNDHTIKMLQKEVAQLKQDNQRLKDAREYEAQKVDDIVNKAREDNRIVEQLEKQMQHEAAKYEDEIHQLQQELSQTESKLISLQKQNDDIIKSRATERDVKSETELRNLIKENSVLTERLADSEHEVKMLSKKLQLHVGALEDGRERISQLEEKNHKLNNQLQKQSRELHDLQFSKNNDFESARNRETQRLQQQVDSLEVEISQCSKRLVEMQKKYDLANEDLSHERMHAENLEKEVNDLEAQLREVKLNQTEVSLRSVKESQDATNEMDKLRRELAEKDIDLEELEVRLVANEKRLDEVLYELKLLDEDYAKVNKINDELKDALYQANEELKELKTHDKNAESDFINELRFKVRQLQEQISDLQDEKDELIANAKEDDRLYKDNVQLVKMVEELQKSLNDLGMSSPEELTQFEMNLKRDLADKNQKIKRGDEVIYKLESKLERAELDKKTLENELRLGQREVEILQEDVKALQEELRILRTKLKDSEQVLLMSDDKLLDAKAELKNWIRAEDSMQDELKRLREDLKLSQDTIKVLQEQLQGQKSSEPSPTITDYMEFQLKSTRKELTEARKSIDELKEKHASDIMLAKEDASSKEQTLQLTINDLKNKLLIKSQEHDRIVAESARLASKMSNFHGNLKIAQDYERADFLKNESIYFKQRYRDTHYRAADFEFLYNFAMDKIKKSKFKDDESVKLAKLGLYPGYVIRKEERPQLTFKTLATFVLAAVKLRRRTAQEKLRYNQLLRVKAELDATRLRLKSAL